MGDLIAILFTIVLSLVSLTLPFAIYIVSFLGIILFLLFLLLALLALYVLEYGIMSLAIYRFAQKAELEKPGLAWVPVVQYYVWGRCIEKYEAERGQQGLPWAKVMMIGSIVAIVAMLSILPAPLSLLLITAFKILILVCVYRVYCNYVSDTLGLVLVLLHVYFDFTNVGLLIASFCKLPSERGAHGAEAAKTDEKS